MAVEGKICQLCQRYFSSLSSTAKSLVEMSNIQQHNPPIRVEKVLHKTTVAGPALTFFFFCWRDRKIEPRKEKMCLKLAKMTVFMLIA